MRTVTVEVPEGHMVKSKSKSGGREITLPFSQLAQRE